MAADTCNQSPHYVTTVQSQHTTTGEVCSANFKWQPDLLDSVLIFLVSSRAGAIRLRRYQDGPLPIDMAGVQWQATAMPPP